MSGNITHYELELAPDRKRVFVTQLREDEEEESKALNIRKFPVVKEKAGKLVELGYNTLQKTLLLKRQVDVADVDREFLEKKFEFRKRMDECGIQNERLRLKQQALKDRMDKFSKFLEENDAKRQRAVLKLQKEQKLKITKQEELEKLEKELNVLVLRTEKLKDKLRRYATFEKYLCSVIDVLPENYVEATDNMLTALMMRYQTLEEANIHLSNKRNNLQSQLESCVQEYQGLSLQQSQNLLLCNKELAESKNKLERLIQRNAKLETITSKKRQRYLNHSETKAEITLAIENLSLQCDQRNIASSLNLSQKLDLIKNYLKERESVCDMSRPSNVTAEKVSSSKMSFQKTPKSVRIKTPVAAEMKR